MVVISTESSAFAEDLPEMLGNMYVIMYSTWSISIKFLCTNWLGDADSGLQPTTKIQRCRADPELADGPWPHLSIFFSLLTRVQSGIPLF